MPIKHKYIKTLLKSNQRYIASSRATILFSRNVPRCDFENFCP